MHLKGQIIHQSSIQITTRKCFIFCSILKLSLIQFLLTITLGFMFSEEAMLSELATMTL